MSSQTRSAAKQQVVFLFVPDPRSFRGDLSPVMKFQMKNLSQDIKYGWRSNTGSLSNVSNWSIGRYFECSFDFEMSLEIWWFFAASRIFNTFSPHAKLPHPIAHIRLEYDRIGKCFVPRMFNQLKMNLRRPMALFSETFDEDSLLHGYRKHTQDV
jgi:hypothetical protein